MIYAIKREGETNEKLVNRFKKQGHWFRIVPLIRGSRYFKKKPSKRLTRQSALVKAKYRIARAKNTLYA